MGLQYLSAWELQYEGSTYLEIRKLRSIREERPDDAPKAWQIS